MHEIQYKMILQDNKNIIDCSSEYITNIESKKGYRPWVQAPLGDNPT
jgi:hypothetical protein